MPSIISSNYEDSLNYLLSGATTDGQTYDGLTFRNNAWLTNSQDNPTSDSAINFSIPSVSVALQTLGTNTTQATLTNGNDYPLYLPVRFTGTNLAFAGEIIYKTYNKVIVKNSTTSSYTSQNATMMVNISSRWFTDLRQALISDSTVNYVSASCSYIINGGTLGTAAGTIKLVRFKLLPQSTYVEDAVLYSKSVIATDSIMITSIKDDTVDGNYRYDIVFDLTGTISSVQLKDRNISIMAVKV